MKIIINFYRIFFAMMEQIVREKKSFFSLCILTIS